MLLILNRLEEKRANEMRGVKPFYFMLISAVLQRMFIRLYSEINSLGAGNHRPMGQLAVANRLAEDGVLLVEPEHC